MATTLSKPVTEEEAFLLDCLPCNSLPFLRRLREILDEAHTNSLESLSGEARERARAVMWVLMSQLYGQLATVDLMDEWEALAQRYGYRAR